MCVNTLRLIRRVDDAPTTEVIREFFYLIGCLFCDKPVHSLRKAEAELREDIGTDIDIILNFNVFHWEYGLPEGKDVQQWDKFIQAGDDRAVSFLGHSNFILRDGHKIFVKFKPPKRKKTKFYRKLINNLISHIWYSEEETKKQLMEINRLYFRHHLLGYLQSKRALRMLDMGEALELTLEQQTIPAEDYIGHMLLAFDQFYRDSVRFSWQPEASIYVRHASINTARKIREVFRLLEKTPAAARGSGESFPSVTYCSASFLFKELGKLYRQEPQYAGTLLLAAHVCQSEPSQEWNAGFYYQQMAEVIAKRDQRAYSFVYYEYGRYIERVENNWNRALRYYKRAWELDPLSYRACFKLACHEVRGKHLADAWMNFNDVIQIIKWDFSGGKTIVWENLSQTCIQYLFKSYIRMWKICLDINNYSLAQVCLHNAQETVDAFKENACLRKVYSSESNTWRELEAYHKTSRPAALLDEIVQLWQDEADILYNRE